MHLHSSGCSACGASEVTEFVNAAAEKEYGGVIFTNHFYHGNTRIDRNLPWSDFFGAYEEDYLKGKELGEKLGVDVLFGIEEGFGDGKELIIYGLEPEVFHGVPDFIRYSLKEISDFVWQNGGFIVCAHPFRNRSYIKDPDRIPDMSCFDAIEGFNHFNRPEDNEKAIVFGKQNGYRMTSGGDIHRVTDFGNSGMAFYERLYTNENLVKKLKSGEYKYIVNGVITDTL